MPYSKEYREKNLIRIRELNKKWNKDNIEKHRKTNSEWYKKNKELTHFRHKKIYLKNNYGLTIEQYNQMFVDQNGICAICNGKNKNGRNLYVDHNHITGKVRGLLCNNCNCGIGYLKENEDILLKAIKYLIKNK